MRPTFEEIDLFRKYVSYKSGVLSDILTSEEESQAIKAYAKMLSLNSIDNSSYNEIYEKELEILDTSDGLIYKIRNSRSNMDEFIRWHQKNLLKK